MRKLKKEIWPFTISIKYDDLSIDNWCEENVGRRFVDFFSYDSEGKRIFAFKDEATLVVFKLRWSYNG